MKKHGVVNKKIKEEKEIKEKKEEIKENIKKISNMLNDNKTESKEFDLVFLIDATGSMGSYIDAARDETENISQELQKLYPEIKFKYGYVFYRDPIDSPKDIHEVIDLTDKVDSLKEKIGKISANGGGDAPEDWVGAYQKANDEISWRNGNKVIIHLADEGAHGKQFTKNDKYPDEGEKIIYELNRCVEKQIKIFGYVITENARNSFNECQKIYKKRGGEYEICDFKIPETNYNFGYLSGDKSYDKDINYDIFCSSLDEPIINYDCCMLPKESLYMKSSPKINKKLKLENKDKKKGINILFKKKVLSTVKNALKKIK
jgi:hypothetical protein